MARHKTTLLFWQMTAFIFVALLGFVILIGITEEPIVLKISDNEQQLEKIEWTQWGAAGKRHIQADSVKRLSNSDKVLINQLNANFTDKDHSLNFRSKLATTTTEATVLKMPEVAEALWSSVTTTVNFVITNSQYRVASGEVQGGQITIYGDGYWLRGDTAAFKMSGNIKLSGAVRAKF